MVLFTNLLSFVRQVCFANFIDRDIANRSKYYVMKQKLQEDIKKNYDFSIIAFKKIYTSFLRR